MTTFEQQLKDALSGTYDIERELGGAGMSRVFVAKERSLGRKVVIKVLSPELTADVNRGRFRREIQVAAQLQHPHIVTLFSAGEMDDLLYYTMPFISGESLKTALEKNGPLPVVEVVRILYHVAEALEYAHDQGVVHRDIKPANILRSGPYSLITDFGVAKALNAATTTSGMTATGMAVGTPAYMAPEQLAGDAAADHRIDIYALGLLAYELLNGKSPFAASTPQRVLAAVLTQEPKPLIEVRPDVPPSLSELIMACLSKEPEKRPANAREVLDALDMFSTASGEIRTTEYTVPRAQRMTPSAPTPVPNVPSLEPTLFIERQTPREEVQASAPDYPSEEVQEASYYVPPKKDRSRLIAGVVALLVPVALVAFYMSQRSGNGTSGDNALPINADLVADSPAAQLPPPVSAPESVVAAVVVPTVDSQAIKDSIRRARREAAAKKAAAESVRIAQEASAARESPRAKARGAAAAMLANESARKSFERGATRMGGLLGTQRRGDLQTQIDALQPFLSQAGLTYQQFKSIVQESGVNLFDEFGRMLPVAMQQFASSGG
ncbi:MAG TPA: protein kinase [Gemmatimonadaceae bacterium]